MSLKLIDVTSFRAAKLPDFLQHETRARDLTKAEPYAELRSFSNKRQIPLIPTATEVQGVKIKDKGKSHNHSVSTGTELLSSLVVARKVEPCPIPCWKELWEGHRQPAVPTTSSVGSSPLQIFLLLAVIGISWSILTIWELVCHCQQSFTVIVDIFYRILGKAEPFSFSFWWPHGSPFLHALANSRGAPQPPFLSAPSNLHAGDTFISATKNPIFYSLGRWSIFFGAVSAILYHALDLSGTEVICALWIVVCHVVPCLLSSIITF